MINTTKITDEIARDLTTKTFEFLYKEIDNMEINESVKMIYFYSVAKALYDISNRALEQCVN